MLVESFGKEANNFFFPQCNGKKAYNHANKYYFFNLINSCTPQLKDI